MKRKISNIFLILLFLTGLSILAYPTISNQWNTYRQNKLISSYATVVDNLEPEDFSSEWEEAKAFNEKIIKNNVYGDAFEAENYELRDTEYWNILNPADDGIMGYLSIPKIDVKLSIYHGTEEEVLQTGVGHMDGSKLPIGGISTHSVLAAHRGLPSARLFTDIDQLKKGDMFYVHVLDEIFAYQVDLILDMVEKDDVNTLSEALEIVEGEDYITLFTCTPYGVNSHRLLVRGTRVPYNGEEEVTASLPETMLKAVQDYYMLYLILALAITFLVIMIMKKFFDKKGGRNEERTESVREKTRRSNVVIHKRTQKKYRRRGPRMKRKRK